MSILVPLPFLQDGDDSPFWDWAVYFSATESENRSHSASVTSRPTETGATITDHVFPQPERLRISGQITGEDASEKLAWLRKFWKTGVLCRYIGRVLLENVVIESFDDSYDNSISNGFRFNMTLKQVVLVDEPEFVPGETGGWIPPDVPPIPEPIPTIPVADFEADVTTGDAPLTVQFTNTTTWAPSNIAQGLKQALWNNGDTDPSTIFSSMLDHKHIYQYPGVYSVSMTAMNAFGSDTEQKTDYITVTGNPPDVRRRLGIIDAIVETVTFNQRAISGAVVFEGVQSPIGKYITNLPDTVLEVIRPEFLWGMVGGGEKRYILRVLFVVQNTRRILCPVYGTPFVDPMIGGIYGSRFQWIFLDVTDTETDITPENFNKSVKLHLYDTEMVEDT
jgi:PKD repeat protein